MSRRNVDYNGLMSYEPILHVARYPSADAASDAAAELDTFTAALKARRFADLDASLWQGDQIPEPFAEFAARIGFDWPLSDPWYVESPGSVEDTIFDVRCDGDQLFLQIDPAGGWDGGAWYAFCRATGATHAGATELYHLLADVSAMPNAAEFVTGLVDYFDDLHIELYEHGGSPTGVPDADGPSHITFKTQASDAAGWYHMAGSVQETLVPLYNELLDDARLMLDVRGLRDLSQEPPRTADLPIDANWERVEID